MTAGQKIDYIEMLDIIKQYEKIAKKPCHWKIFVDSITKVRSCSVEQANKHMKAMLKQKLIYEENFCLKIRVAKE